MQGEQLNIPINISLNLIKCQLDSVVEVGAFVHPEFISSIMRLHSRELVLLRGQQ